ncbi:GntR family transcriptional regulator [Falsirhodobacter sp. 20TX0035]|uniref:GntR family transcriptional regulator n=1 Tax=Falsirhodobacter sp. 20TX0035 TaxID=3022019 RepID=UPI0023305443|nr:GntR family transcriptional regulator [Falsirhodobacter sp. 20TX0035]MDB6454153.1 GntR family transcriptional regulator [Falsirhodobacter sp. 20TX0035]
MIDRTPVYATMTAHLRDAIADGRLPRGTVLLESGLAALFGSSRAPVKQALATLEEEGTLSRFDGRGLLVGGGDPVRLRLTADMLGLTEEAPAKAFTWHPFYYDFEREIILHSVFGRFRVNELALARHLDVGRTVARDLLIQAEKLGLVQKGERAHWWIVPLDEARFQHLYQLRILLEPAALESAISRMPTDMMDHMMDRLRGVSRSYPTVAEQAFDQLETDLHVDCLQFTANPEVAAALKRTHCILVSGKHIQVALGRSPDPFMDEHLEILQAAKAGDTRKAKAALVRHLTSSARKSTERLTAFHAQIQAAPPPYIHRL